MNIFVSLLIVGVLVAAGILLMRKPGKDRQRPTPQRPTPGSSAGSTSQFHAVSIKFSADACDAAKQLDGKRFLSTAAPRIPLADCNVLECKCRFVHYQDRRSNEDRRNPYRSSIGGTTGEHPVEQRAVGDRRAEPPDDY